MNDNYKPEFYRLDSEHEFTVFNALIATKHPVKYDTIQSQLFELMLCRNPSKSKDEVREAKLVEKHLSHYSKEYETYGVWVYYSWSNKLVHLLDQEEFIEVRTNRNKYKITQEEQDTLRTKKVGIIGLSVGRAVATTIALERVAGAIHLADMDTIELSNLNRIKAPLTQLDRNKATSAAQEIAEIDPFIKVTCFCDGYNDDVANDFFGLDGQIDMLIEECDDIGVKIKARQKAKSLGVPVIMETNDNCVVDIERFDLEPDRPLFHGKLSEEDIRLALNAKTIEEKTYILTKILDITKISKGMALSLQQLGKEVRNWPQLGSEIFIGAGIVTSLVKRVLIGDNEVSRQQYYY